MEDRRVGRVDVMEPGKLIRSSHGIAAGASIAICQPYDAAVRGAAVLDLARAVLRAVVVLRAAVVALREDDFAVVARARPAALTAVARRRVVVGAVPPSSADVEARRARVA
jgi:hypothetical protein